MTFTFTIVNEKSQCGAFPYASVSSSVHALGNTAIQKKQICIILRPPWRASSRSSREPKLMTMLRPALSLLLSLCALPSSLLGPDPFLHHPALVGPCKNAVNLAGGCCCLFSCCCCCCCFGSCCCFWWSCCCFSCCCRCTSRLLCLCFFLFSHT